MCSGGWSPRQRPHNESEGADVIRTFEPKLSAFRTVLFDPSSLLAVLDFWIAFSAKFHSSLPRLVSSEIISCSQNPLRQTTVQRNFEIRSQWLNVWSLCSRSAAQESIEKAPIRVQLSRENYRQRQAEWEFLNEKFDPLTLDGIEFRRFDSAVFNESIDTF